MIFYGEKGALEPYLGLWVCTPMSCPLISRWPRPWSCCSSCSTACTPWPRRLASADGAIWAGLSCWWCPLSASPWASRELKRRNVGAFSFNFLLVGTATSLREEIKNLSLLSGSLCYFFAKREARKLHICCCGSLESSTLNWASETLNSS